MSARSWSPQQHAILDWFRDASGHLVVRARAGTGKTTTIVEGVTFAPEGRILVAAFNKRIQEELAGRITNQNAQALTLHSVGFACVRRYWEGVGLCTPGYQRARVLAEAVCGGRAPDAIKKLVGDLMTKGREILPHATEPGSLLELAEQFECVPDDLWVRAGFDVDYVDARALEAMEMAAAEKPATGIDFADMLYLPVRNGWLQEQYDLVVVDEAQDMTVTQLEIARGVCGGRIAVVGDDRQAIYAFRGADSNSLDRLKTELDAVELGLTTTYRCGKVIAEAARRLVPDLEAAATNPEGAIRSVANFDGLLAEAEPGDFVLSRTNAPLAKVAMALLRANKRVKIQGKDIGAGLVALVQKLSKRQATILDFLGRLTAWETREVERVWKMDREDLVDAIRDKAETLRVLTDGLDNIEQLQGRLSVLFSDDPAHGQAIVCSSVHKAKGLEAPRVYVLRPTLYPQPPIRKGKPAPPPEVLALRRREEQNIEYVAITRAQQTLVWVEAK